MASPIRVAHYARVSTGEQTTENQLLELRRYVEARGWTIFKEYCDQGVSGAKDRRPALDDMLTDARRRRFDIIVCWKLDRLGRNVRHLVLLLDEFTALGVGFATLGEGIDTSTPAGRLTAGLLSAVASFERERIQERVKAGLARARAQGKKLGRPFAKVPADRLTRVRNLSVNQAATVLGVSRSTVKRWRRTVQQSPSSAA
jgi:DNA invertase Pin-like site-specific DNA recombinase